MDDDLEILPSSLRMPVDLKAAVLRRAKHDGRSFSQQVIWVLRQYVENSPEPKVRARKL